MDSPTLASPPLDCWPADSRPGTTPDTFGRAARRSKTFPNRRLHPFSVRPGGDDTVRHNRVSECASGAANPTIESASLSFSISPGFSHVSGTVCEAFRDLDRFPKTGTPLCNSPRLGRVAGTRSPAANVIGPLRRAALTESCAAPTAPSQIRSSLGGSNVLTIYICIIASFTTNTATRHSAPAECAELAEIFL